LESIDINPESVLAIRDGDMKTADTELVDGDQIRVVYVISGG